MTDLVKGFDDSFKALGVKDLAAVTDLFKVFHAETDRVKAFDAVTKSRPQVCNVIPA